MPRELARLLGFFVGLEDSLLLGRRAPRPGLRPPRRRVRHVDAAAPLPRRRRASVRLRRRRRVRLRGGEVRIPAAVLRPAPRADFEGRLGGRDGGRGEARLAVDALGCDILYAGRRERTGVRAGVGVWLGVLGGAAARRRYVLPASAQRLAAAPDHCPCSAPVALLPRAQADPAAKRHAAAGADGPPPRRGPRGRRRQRGGAPGRRAAPRRARRPRLPRRRPERRRGRSRRCCTSRPPRARSWRRRTPRPAFAALSFAGALVYARLRLGPAAGARAARPPCWPPGRCGAPRRR